MLIITNQLTSLKLQFKSTMDIGGRMGGDSSHLTISLPNGDEVEHKQVPNTETLWNILLQFQAQKNQNLCKKYNKDNRYELPQLLYNNYPFASTLTQLLSTTLFDIAKHKKPNKSNSRQIKLTLIFQTQAFSINELDAKLAKIQKELKKKDMDIDDTKNDNDNDEDEHKKSGLSNDFAMDIDPVIAQNTEEIFRKMEMLLYKLCKLLSIKQDFIACMKLLRKVVNNLVIHPLDKVDDKKNKDPTKYRKLNLNNDKLQNKLFKYKPALDLLLLIGFIQKSSSDTENYLILPSQNENVVVFQALIVKIGNCQPPKAAVPVIDKEIKIYLWDDLRKFKVEEAKIIAQENANKSQSETSLASQHRIAAQKAYKKHHPTELMGKALREKKYGVKQKEYKFTVIRVEFPSKYVLEAKFHPLAAIYKLFEFVDGALDENIKTYKYELLLPPHQIIQNKHDNDQTFKSVGGMIPACTVRFVFDTKSKKNKNINYNDNYIKNGDIQKYFTDNITSLRSSKSLIADEQKSNASNDNNSNNKNQKKSAKTTAAEFKAMKERKKLQAKLDRLNRK